MKYINANIKSKKELYRRLLDGEVFYVIRECCDLVEVFYDECNSVDPFRIRTESEINSYPLRSLADNYSDLCIAREPQWWDYPLPNQGLLVGRKTMTGAKPILITSIKAEIATTSLGTKFNVHDLIPLTPDDPRIFRESIYDV